MLQKMSCKNFIFLVVITSLLFFLVGDIVTTNTSFFTFSLVKITIIFTLVIFMLIHFSWTFFKVLNNNFKSKQTISELINSVKEINLKLIVKYLVIFSLLSSYLIGWLIICQEEIYEYNIKLRIISDIKLLNNFVIGFNYFYSSNIILYFSFGTMFSILCGFVLALIFFYVNLLLKDLLFKIKNSNQKFVTKSLKEKNKIFIFYLFLIEKIIYFINLIKIKILNWKSNIESFVNYKNSMFLKLTKKGQTPPILNLI